MTTFKNKVYELTRKIPKGKVATYGQIARLAGNKKAARAVGMFMMENLTFLLVRGVAVDDNLCPRIIYRSHDTFFIF